MHRDGAARIREEGSVMELDRRGCVVQPRPPAIGGWINYYGQFYRAQLRSTLQRIDGYLVRWARRKYKRLRERPKGTRDWLARVRRANPNLFAHWRFVNVGGRTSEAV